MKFDDPIGFLFLAFFLAILGFFAFRVIKHGGFKAAMFGAPIRKTLGEVTSQSTSFVTLLVRVHALDSISPDKAVGVELVAKSLGSYSMTPISLSKASAKKLAALLQSAAQ